MKSNLQYSAKLFICTARSGEKILCQPWEEDSYTFFYKDNIPYHHRIKKVLAKTQSEAANTFFQYIRTYFPTRASGKWQLIPHQNTIYSVHTGFYHIEEFEELNDEI